MGWALMRGADGMIVNFLIRMFFTQPQTLRINHLEKEFETYMTQLVYLII